MVINTKGIPPPNHMVNPTCTHCNTSASQAIRDKEWRERESVLRHKLNNPRPDALRVRCVPCARRLAREVGCPLSVLCYDPSKRECVVCFKAANSFWFWSGRRGCPRPATQSGALRAAPCPRAGTKQPPLEHAGLESIAAFEYRPGDDGR